MAVEDADTVTDDAGSLESSDFTPSNGTIGAGGYDKLCRSH